MSTAADHEQARAEVLAAFGANVPLGRATLPVDAYAAQLVRRRDAQARIDLEGALVAGPRDQPIPHPALAVERAATAEIAKLHRLLVKEARIGRSGFARRGPLPAPEGA